MSAALSQLPGGHDIKDIPPQDVPSAEDRDYYEQRAAAQAEGWPEGYRPLPQGEDQ